MFITIQVDAMFLLLWPDKLRALGAARSGTVCGENNIRNILYTIKDRE